MMQFITVRECADLGMIIRSPPEPSTDMHAPVIESINEFTNLQDWFDNHATCVRCDLMSEDCARDVWTRAVHQRIRMRAIHAIAICQSMDALPTIAFVRARCIVNSADIACLSELAIYYNESQAREQRMMVMRAICATPKCISDHLLSQWRHVLYGAQEVYETHMLWDHIGLAQSLRADCFAAFARGLARAESPVSLIDANIARKISRATLN